MINFSTNDIEAINSSNPNSILKINETQDINENIENYKVN